MWDGVQPLLGAQGWVTPEQGLPTRRSFSPNPPFPKGAGLVSRLDAGRMGAELGHQMESMQNWSPGLGPSPPCAVRQSLGAVGWVWPCLQRARGDGAMRASTAGPHSSCIGSLCQGPWKPTGCGHLLGQRCIYSLRIALGRGQWLSRKSG